MTFSSIFPWKLLLLISISLFFEFIKADIYPLNSANPDEAFDSDASFPIIVPNDGSDNTGNIILGMSTRTKEPLDAPNDANLAPLYIANDKSNICEIQSSTIRRVRRDNKREPNACVMQTSPPASETKPEQNSAGDGPGVGKPPEKQPGKIPPFDPAREPSFSGFHFRENTSVCPHKSVTIPVCALQVDERDWATSTSVSFLSSLLECVACTWTLVTTLISLIPKIMHH